MFTSALANGNIEEMRHVLVLAFLAAFTAQSSLANNNIAGLFQKDLKVIAQNAKDRSSAKWLAAKITGIANYRHYDAWKITGTRTNPELFVRKFDRYDKHKGEYEYDIVNESNRTLTNQEYAEFLIINDVNIGKDVLEKFKIDLGQTLRSYLDSKKFTLTYPIMNEMGFPQSISFEGSNSKGIKLILKENLGKPYIFSAEVFAPFGTIPCVIKTVSKHSTEQVVLEKFGSTEGIIGYFGALESEGFFSQAALLMEKGEDTLGGLDGKRLLDLYSRNPIQEIIHLVHGLKTMHDGGYVHTDINIYNVVLNPQKHLVFIDFGFDYKISSGQRMSLSSLGKLLKESYWNKMYLTNPRFVSRETYDTLFELLKGMEDDKFTSIGDIEKTLDQLSKSFK